MTATLQEMMAPRRSGFSQLTEAAGKMFADELLDPVAALREDRTRIFEPLNVAADSWQRDVLDSTAKSLMLLCSRQSGKSFICAASGLLDALLHPWSEVLIISRTLRQSSELMRKVKELWRGLTGGRVNRRRAWAPVPLQDEVKEVEAQARVLGWDGAALLGDVYRAGAKELKLSHELPNGSRITCLPGNADNIVSFSAVTLLILDEASRVPDQLLSVVRPFLAATEAVHGRPGRLIAASTPFGKRGWFWEAWDRTTREQDAHDRGVRDKANGLTHCPYNAVDAERRVEREAWKRGHEGGPADLSWQIVQVTAAQCPRISAEFLEDERVQLGERWYEQEYFCAWVDLMDSVFSYDDVHGMVDGSIKPRKLWCS